MITSNVNNTSTTLAMPEDPPDDIGVALLPSKSVLLHFPSIYDVSHKVKSIATVVLEKIVESLGLAVLGS